jgi:hypothetical protein
MDGGSFVDLVGFDIGNTPGMITGVTGITGSTGNSFHIIGNYVHDLGSTANTNQPGPGCPGFGEILTFNGTHTDYQILRNIVVRYGANSGAPTTSGVCNVSHNLYLAANTRVEANIVANAPTSNLQVHSDACNVGISNNVFLSARRGLIIDNSAGTTASCPNPGSIAINNNYFANHTVGGGGSSAIAFGATECTAETPNFIGHNISDGASADFAAGLLSCDTSTSSTWTHQSPASFFQNYTSTGSGDYHLRVGSSGIAAGTPTCNTSMGALPCLPTTDFEGTAMSSPVPVGAYSPATSTGDLLTAPTNLTAVVQ